MNNDPFKGKVVCINCVHHRDHGNYPIVCTKHLREVDYVYGSKHYENANKHNGDGDCKDFEPGNPTYETVNEELAAQVSTAMALLGAGRNETLVNAVRSMLAQADLVRMFNRQLSSSWHQAATELAKATGLPPAGAGHGWDEILEEVSELVRKARSGQ